MRRNGYGHTAQPLEQIQLMRALVDQHAAAFSGPGASPSALIVISLRTVPVRDYPVYTLDTAQPAAFDEFLCETVQLVGALVIHYAEYEFGFGSRDLVHLSDRLRIHARGFFDKCVQPFFQRVDGDYGVIVVRSGDKDGVYLSRVYQRLVIVEKFDALGNEFFFSPFFSVGRNIANRRQHGVLDKPVSKAHAMLRTHFTYAYNTESDFVHALFPASSMNFLRFLYCKTKTSFLVTLVVLVLPSFSSM